MTFLATMPPGRLAAEIEGGERSLEAGNLTPLLNVRSGAGRHPGVAAADKIITGR